MSINFRFLLYTLLCVLSINRVVKSETKNSGNKPTVNCLLLKNRSSVYLQDKDVTLSLPFFLSASGELYPVLKTANGITIPSQTEDVDADGKWDNLFFVVDIKPKSEMKIFVEWQDIKPIYTKRSTVTFGKRNSSSSPVVTLIKDTFYPNMLPSLLGYEPYKTDGPTWENDKVGFRHYFDGRNSKDLFGKLVPGMMPKDVGLDSIGSVEDNYHVLKDWGRDILPVGNSVGIGGIGLLIDKRFNRLGGLITDTMHNIENTKFSILSSGPVKSAFSLSYNNWRALDNRIYQVSETPVIWPGKYAYQNNIRFSGLRGDEELVIGLPKVATYKPVKQLMFKNWVIIYTHDHQSYDKEYIVGLAIIIPASSFLGYDRAPETGNFSSSYYARLKVSDDKVLTYYALGCWELSDLDFKSEVKFKKYLKSFVKQTEAEISVELIM